MVLVVEAMKLVVKMLFVVVLVVEIVVFVGAIVVGTGTGTGLAMRGGRDISNPSKQAELSSPTPAILNLFIFSTAALFETPTFPVAVPVSGRRTAGFE